MVAVMKRATFDAAPTDGRYAALYVRVSTEKQRDNWSVKDQLALAKLGAERGLPVVEYPEQAVSGETIEERPVMQRLLSDLDAGKVAAVIAVDWNRLSRDEDLLDGLRIKKACKDNNALVLTPGRLYDFSTESDGFLAQLEMMFAASQKQKNVKALTRGSYAKFRASGWAGGIPRYGYRVVHIPLPNDKTATHLEIDADAAEVVRLIFDLYANGLTTDGAWRLLSDSAIARHLNALGHRHPVTAACGNKKRAKFKTGELRPFERFDVLRIVRCRAYMGFFERGVSQLSKWVRDDGPAEVHLPDLQIVDVTTWQRANAERTARAQGPRKLACSVYPLAGLLKCPHCGGPSRVQTFTDGAHSYQCDTSKRFGVERCRGFTLSGRAARLAADALLIEHLEALDLRSYLERAAEDEAAESEGEIAQSVLVELQQTEDKLQRLVAAVADGVFSPAEARNVKLDLMEKKERLEHRLRKLRQRAAVREELTEAVDRVHANLHDRIATLDGARFRQLARLVFSRIVMVGEGNTTQRRAVVVDHGETEEFASLLPIGSAATRALSNAYLESGPLSEVLGLLGAAA